jgi:predicted nucleotidyltransferase
LNYNEFVFYINLSIIGYMHEFESYQQLIVPVLKRYLIKRAAIFGSFAKGKANSESDVDLLIGPEKGFTIFNLLKLEEEITALTNRKVDLVEYNALKPSIREEVLLSAISIL